jgi:membrane-associated phospholipid phosphatase
MYLSEHFLIDVYVGSIIGTVCALFTFRFVANWKWLNKFAAIDKPLIRL